MLSTGGSRTPATYKMELFVRIFLFILLTASIVPNAGQKKIAKHLVL